MDNSFIPEPLWSYKDIGCSVWLLGDIPVGVSRSASDRLPYSKTYFDMVAASIRKFGAETCLVLRSSEQSRQGDYGKTYMALAKDTDVLTAAKAERSIRESAALHAQRCGADLLATVHRNADKGQPLSLSAISMAQISSDWSAELRAKVKASEEKRRLDSRILVDIQDLD